MIQRGRPALERDARLDRYLTLLQLNMRDFSNYVVRLFVSPTTLSILQGFLIASLNDFLGLSCLNVFALRAYLCLFICLSNTLVYGYKISQVRSNN